MSRTTAGRTTTSGPSMPRLSRVGRTRRFRRGLRRRRGSTTCLRRGTRCAFCFCRRGTGYGLRSVGSLCLTRGGRTCLTGLTPCITSRCTRSSRGRATTTLWTAKCCGLLRRRWSTRGRNVRPASICRRCGRAPAFLRRSCIPYSFWRGTKTCSFRRKIANFFRIWRRRSCRFRFGGGGLSGRCCCVFWPAGFGQRRGGFGAKVCRTAEVRTFVGTSFVYFLSGSSHARRCRSSNGGGVTGGGRPAFSRKSCCFAFPFMSRTGSSRRVPTARTRKMGGLC